MAAGSSIQWGKVAKAPVFNPVKETVNSLRKRVNPAFRPPWDRLPVTNEIQSCCFTQAAMEEYIQEYHSFLTKAKWKWNLLSSSRNDMSQAWIRPTDFEIWAVERSGNIGRTYVFRFDNCQLGQQQKIQFGNPAEIVLEGKKFRDGDLCYCFCEETDALVVYELFYLETVNGKSGFSVYGIHKWVPSDLDDWKSTIGNLFGVYYFHEQPGTMKVYEK